MGDKHREEVPLAPEATPVLDANRRHFQQLLRELLRDESIRRLLCVEEEPTSQPQDGE